MSSSAEDKGPNLSEQATKCLDNGDVDNYRLEYTKQWVNNLPCDVVPLEELDNFEARCQTEQISTKANKKKKANVVPKKKPGALNIALKRVQMSTKGPSENAQTTNSECIAEELTRSEKVKVIIKKLVCQNTYLADPKTKMYPENPVPMDNLLRQEIEMYRTQKALNQIEILWKFQSSYLLRNCNQFPRQVEMSNNQKYMYRQLINDGTLPKMIIQYIKILEKRKLESEDNGIGKNITWTLQPNDDIQSKVETRTEKEVESTKVANNGKAENNKKNVKSKPYSKSHKTKEAKAPKVLGKGKLWALKLIGDANLTQSQEDHLITEKMLERERRLSSQITTSFSSSTLTEGESRETLVAQPISVIDNKPSTGNKKWLKCRTRKQNQVPPSTTTLESDWVPKQRQKKMKCKRNLHCKQKEYSEIYTTSEPPTHAESYKSTGMTSTFSNKKFGMAKKCSNPKSLRIIEKARMLRTSDTNSVMASRLKYKGASKRITKKIISQMPNQNKTYFYEIEKGFKKFLMQNTSFDFSHNKHKKDEEKKPVPRMQPWMRKIFGRSKNTQKERSVVKKFAWPSEDKILSEKIMKLAKEVYNRKDDSESDICMHGCMESHEKFVVEL
ncbi:uncharacterized protein LOC119662147 isoform X2 [Teleopsis dalmanni]|uniref:uncharacterized protein LOC119662147 isoform X2 n=1 Tax=Teleopsis dalmanni TaxID=139649 RepID=UPI0018CEE3FD|nr:uncharacterized protein LOC119662147 isoform X2 [Teleopsis dalmanni]